MKEMIALLALSGGEAILLVAALIIAGMLLTRLLQLPKAKHINTKLFGGVAAAVTVAVFLLWSITQPAFVGGTETLFSSGVEYALFILTLPAQLYMASSGGRHSSPPFIVALMLVNGLIWGLLIERVVAKFFAEESTD